MGVIDKFLNAMKMNDDDALDDDYLDDEDDDDLDFLNSDTEKSRILNRSKQDSDEDSLDETLSPSSSSAFNSSASKSSRSRQTHGSSSKVSPMRTNSSRKTGMEVCVIRPKSMEDARDVTETLLDECTVILNMEGIDYDLAQRIIDFSCGSCYAIHGKLQKVSDYIFIITPASVDISGDFQEMMSGAYDVPTFESNF